MRAQNQDILWCDIIKLIFRKQSSADLFTINSQFPQAAILVAACGHKITSSRVG